jgi:hypothetical protein
MPRTPLALYLQDHRAGAAAGIQLARRCARRAERTDGGRDLAAVAAEIEQDCATLERLMAALEVRPSPTKDAIARLAELAARLKSNGRTRGDSSMQRLYELEALSLGIAGKLALWEALRRALETHAPAGIDLDELAARARSQRELVEAERLTAARIALAP